MVEGRRCVLGPCQAFGYRSFDRPPGRRLGHQLGRQVCRRVEAVVQRMQSLLPDSYFQRKRVLPSMTTVHLTLLQLADGGLGNSENAMSASMTVNGVPNDLLNNFNPLSSAFLCFFICSLCS